jgi:hypothetical protein
MKLKVVPASRGWAWTRQGLLLSRQQPLGFVSLLGLIITAAMILMALPLIGPLIVISLMPVVWMAFMLASRRALTGQRITPGVLIEALADPATRPQWLRLGGAYTVATMVVMALSSVLGPDMDAMVKALEAAKDSQEALDDPVLLSSLLWRVGLTLPVSLVFWHTPALLHWAHLPAGKALFFSAVACWRNLGAFLVFGASWLALIVLVGLPIQAIAALIPEPTISAMVAAAAGLWLVGAFYASLYFSVVECFDNGQDWQAPQPPPG